jgi:hypothetical protein|tara:strand:- start:199 stop:438 length:240 start_codon:yes stop_codon:yes gene_type:complete
MDNEELEHAMQLAESLCLKIYTILSEEEKNDKALIIALVWAAMGVGLKSEIEPDIIRLVVVHATESALEEYTEVYETIH